MCAMRREDRAKQFMPFAALKGYEEEIFLAGKVKEERRELSEDELERLNRQLQQMEPGDRITVGCYEIDRYIDFEGRLEMVDWMHGSIRVGGRNIAVRDITDIRPADADPDFEEL